ncbi:glycosyltransferase family 2 protein [Sulfurimonas sp. HSL-1656]|uniref:glycosyltransferase family 2 protein n=1 Tax=Thiomicrolovo subterrani TaxID=3131934 RepID=UPI0031FA45AC
MSSIHISVVTPVYGCAASLEQLYERLVKTLTKINETFEIIMVNDGSPDDAWEKIQKLAANDNRVKGIRLSRNFGQHHAISAGLDNVFGDWVVVMDCDLQDQPEEILKLYEKTAEGYDIVVGQREERQDGFLKRMGSALFHKLFNYLTDQKNDARVANFGIYANYVIESYKQFKEQNRFFPFFINWMGYNRAEIPIIHAERSTGKSHYSLEKLFDLAIDTIVSYSNKPLRLSIKIGFVISVFSMLYAVWLIVQYFMYGIPVEGWTSVMVSLFFMGGLILANLGILGLYIGRVFEETKKRPFYIIQEKVNC